MDDETRDLLKSSVRDLFASGDGDIVTGLADLGWSDVVAEDANAANDLLFTTQGEAGKASSALDAVAFARDAEGNTYPVVHPMGGLGSAGVTGDRIDIDGVVLVDQDSRVVVATADGSTYVVEAEEWRQASTAVVGFDEASRLRRVRTTVGLDAVSQVSVEWTAVTTAARRALAAELVGNGTAMLSLATEQVAARHQFGRPIGANQNPRHRLAECYALLRGAAELASVAWSSGSGWDARTAKAYAGYAVDTTSRACLQVCGAIGLTTEHQLPALVKRARILDALYGGWSATTGDIGADLLAASAVPPNGRL
jgi:alkylation response protein AidB-like acyl-CoA dehydrogenase